MRSRLNPFNLLLVSCWLICAFSAQAADPNFVGTHFSGSGNCSQCHDGMTDSQGNDLSIVNHWSNSMMANSTKDPYWRAKVASELFRNPGLADVINDKCTRCHAPMANDAMQKEQMSIAVLESDNGVLNAAHPYHNQAMDGVSCTACHQIANDDTLGTLDGFSGKYHILEYTDPLSRPIYGQFSNVRTNPMRNSVGFTPQYGSHMTESKVCATCHNLKTPFVDANGNVMSTTPESEFPEQMVFTEWQYSAFADTTNSNAKTCQQCHMPVIDDAVVIATTPPNLTPRNGFAKHTFLGANTLMMEIMDTYRDELGVTATGFNDAISATRTMLQTSATLSIQDISEDDDDILVTVKVTNNIGHKFPTSFPSRRAWIHFTATNEAGDIVFESGKLNANGSIVGNNGDADSSAFEPHYSEISTSDQVQIYEPIMVDTDGAVTHTLLRAAAFVKDNRVLPTGFDKQTVPNDIAVKGAAFDDTDFVGGGDTVVYRLAKGSATSLNINATLLYQTIAYGHIQDMFADADQVTEIADFQADELKTSLKTPASCIAMQSDNVPFTLLS